MKEVKNQRDKYDKILQAATKVFAKKGFFASKVSEIAKEAGVADGTIYLYFENKDHILISIFEEKMQLVLDNMVKELSSEPGPIEKLKKFAQVHLKLIEGNKDMAELIQVELRQSSKFMKNYKNEKFLRYLDLIAEILREGQEMGIFKREIIPGVFKRAFFGALDEMSRFWVLSTKKYYDINTAADQISSYFLKGICA
ncbi:MAG: TetR/AcrR family transcriptional regulator [Desulfatiglandales bacterium]